MRRRLAVLVSSAFLLSGLLPTAVGAASAPLPESMVAVGDSISQAASTGGSLGADYPQNAWSTGTNTTVNSHYLRLLAAGAPISGAARNLSVSGAKVGGLDAQMQAAAPLQPDYLTVLIGGNDLCTDTVGSMTSTTAFESAFRTAMNTITRDSGETRVYVVSIPDVYQLWNLFKGNFWARFVWSAGNICQSLLASPTSTQQADVQRRADVQARNQAFNAILANVCKDYVQCHHDGGRVFAYQFARSDVSADYFHPSTSGQANLARETWLAGYSWTTDPDPPQNQPPTASFAYSCTDLTCAFTDTSTDTDGTIVSRSWSFGDGSTSTATNPSRTYAAGGTFSVALTVTDDDGATASTTRTVTATAPVTNAPPTAAFFVSCIGLTCSFTDTSTDADGTIAMRSWSFGDGTTSTATNPSKTYAAGGTYTASLTVTDDDGATNSTSQMVTVEPPSSASARVAALSGQGTSVNRNFWRASVTVTVTDTEGTALSGATVTGSFTTGGTKSCTTGSNGQCTLASDNLRTNLASVSWSISGVTHASHAYDPTENLASTVTVARP